MFVEISSYEILELRNQILELTNEVTTLRKEMKEQIRQPSSTELDDYNRTVVNEFDKNYKAYELQEASLIEKYNGQWVAFCNGEQVAIGSDRKQVVQLALQAEPEARPYIRKIGERISSASPLRR